MAGNLSGDSGTYQYQSPEDTIEVNMASQTESTAKTKFTRKWWPAEEENLLIEHYNIKITAEKESGATNHTWQEWDQEASLFLLQNGYSRTVAACASRWKIVQERQGLVGNSNHESDFGASDEESISQASEPDRSESESRNTASMEPVALDEQWTPSNQRERIRAPRVPWSDSEKAALVDLVNRKLESADTSNRPHKVIPFWEAIAAQLYEKGFKRTKWQAKGCYEKIEGELSQDRERQNFPPHKTPDLNQHRISSGDHSASKGTEQSRQVNHDADHAGNKKGMLSEPQESLSDALGRPDQNFSRRGLVPPGGRKYFTQKEKAELEDIFQSNQRPQDGTIQRLANTYDTTPKKVKAWFSNRRQSERQKGEDNVEQSFQPGTGNKRGRVEASGTDELREETPDVYSENTRDNKPHGKKSRVRGGAETPTHEPVAPERPRSKTIEYEYNPATGNIKRKVGLLDPARFSASRNSSIEATAVKSFTKPSEKNETSYNPAREPTSSSVSTSMPPAIAAPASTNPSNDKLESSRREYLRQLDGHIKELSALQAKGEASLNNMETQCANYSSEVESIQSRHAREIEALQKNHQAEIEGKMQEYNRLKVQMDKKVGDLHAIGSKIKAHREEEKCIERRLSNE